MAESVLKRIAVAEWLTGMAVCVVGLLLGGTTLPVLGAYLASVAVMSAAARGKKGWLTVGMSVVCAVWLIAAGLFACSVYLRSSRYFALTSPLSAVFVAAVALLAQMFFRFWTEDEPSLLRFRRELSAAAIGCGGAFVGIVLTYVLSYATDAHHCECAVGLALALTGLRNVFGAVFAKNGENTEKEGTV